MTCQCAKWSSWIITEGPFLSAERSILYLSLPRNAAVMRSPASAIYISVAADRWGFPAVPSKASGGTARPPMSVTTWSAFTV